MTNIDKWAIAGNALTCVLVWVAFVITHSPWSFVLLGCLTVYKKHSKIK